MYVLIPCVGRILVDFGWHEKILDQGEGCCHLGYLIGVDILPSQSFDLDIKYNLGLWLETPSIGNKSGTNNDDFFITATIDKETIWSITTLVNLSKCT